MAGRNGFGLIDAAAKTPGGWLFYVEQRVDAEGLPDPGGPSPIFVSTSGEARTVLLPSDEGFAILDSIVEEDIPLPRN